MSFGYNVVIPQLPALEITLQQTFFLIYVIWTYIKLKVAFKKQA